MGELGLLHVHHGRLLESAVAARDLNSGATVLVGVCVRVRVYECE